MEIMEVTLQTNELDKLKEFYHIHLGFSLLEDDDYSFCVAIGTSHLRFTNRNVKGRCICES